MEKNEIELLHNELITTDRLEEIELSECVKKCCRSRAKRIPRCSLA